MLLCDSLIYLYCAITHINGINVFLASIAQMTKFYTLMWDEMAVSRNKILEATHSGPFIFIPSRNGSRQEDLVPGFFFSLEEVYWQDPTGSVDQLKRIHPKCSVTANEHPMNKTLCNVYPGLHDFFKECGVPEFPSSCAYLDLLQQLSTVALPSQSASMVKNRHLKKRKFVINSWGFLIIRFYFHLPGFPSFS